MIRKYFFLCAPLVLLFNISAYADAPKTVHVVNVTHAENLSGLDVFKNDRQDVTLYYPKGWHIQEIKYNNPYEIIISREDTNNLTQDYKTGVSLIKIYNQSWYEQPADNQNPDVYYNRLVDSFDKAPNLKTIIHDRITIAGVPALHLEQTVTSKDRKTHMISVHVLKDDIKIDFILEAPEAEFENYREIFENIIHSSSFFAQNKDSKDNEILRKEVENLVLKEMERKNMEGHGLDKSIEVFEKAIAMSPGNATLKALFGGFIFETSKMGTDGVKRGMSQAIFQALEQSNALYQQFPNSYEEFLRKFYQSQNYFLMGDTYTYFLKQPEKARPYYQKSLTFFNHPGAKRELEKFGKN